MSLMLRLCSIAVFLAIVNPFEAHGQWVWSPETGRFINLKRLPKETPELQIEYARTLLLQGQFRDALDETNKFADYYGDSELADENQFIRGEIELGQEDFLRAAKEFQQVIDSYPESDRFPDVITQQYSIGDTLFEKGKLNMEGRSDRPWYGIRWRPWGKRPFKRAIEVYTMVKNNQPFTPEAAQAQYKIGLCHYTREEYIDAALEYRLVVEQYPTSNYVKDASYGLVQCYDESSLGPDYDQSPSRLAMNAIDEYSVRFPDDERKEELTAVKQEKFENIAEQRFRTARFYEKRRQYSSARIYYELLAADFQGTVAAGKAQEWLAEHPEGTMRSGILFR